MSTIHKCPRSGQTSSKRVIALCLAGTAILLSFVLVIGLIFEINISDNAVDEISKIIVTFALGSGATQATTMRISKNDEAVGKR